jgi:hypothetical protein
MRAKYVLAVIAVIAVGMLAIPATSSAASLKGVQTQVNKAAKSLRALKIENNVRFKNVEDKVDGVLAVAPQIIDGLTKLKEALESPGVKGQLSAAGTAAPGAANAATPSDLPTGTLYRQIVLSTGGAFGPGAPIGARTWVKMPDVAALGYSNKYACTSAGLTDTAAGAAYTITCTTP